MWRNWSSHKRGESEFLAEAVGWVRTLTPAFAGLRTGKPALPQGGRELNFLLGCPQSADTHAEGSAVEDHLKLMLQVLFAVVNGELHLADIEELRRLKGFEGELDEIEETMKEKVASLEAFILCHDLGKPETIRFEARDGSIGASLGFNESVSSVWNQDKKSRQKLIEKYNQEYKKFALSMEGVEPEEIQAAFSSSHQISISYPGYAEAIAHPDLRSELSRVCEEKRLTPEDSDDVFHLILLHEKVVRDFSLDLNISAYDHLIKYTIKHRRDADDFLDLLLAAIFLEVVASPRRSAHGIYFDLLPVINFLVTEHETVPEKREERLKQKKEKQLKIERQLFREAKLDGNDLMVLFGLKPSREFGQLLLAIQDFARGEAAAPSGVPLVVREELFKRIERFRALHH